MTGSLLPLFLCGVTAGVCSVLFFFLRGLFAGRYPPRRFLLLLPKSVKKKKKKQGRTLGFLLDFAFCFLFGAYLVLYDATVLMGRGRIHHLCAFLFGCFLVRRLFLSVLFRPTERVIVFFLDLLRFLVRCTFYPVRKCFSLLFAILSSLYLILKAKNDRIRMKRKAKREIGSIEGDAGRAFLPAAVTEAIASGRD